MTPKWATRGTDDGRAGGALSEQVARSGAEVAEALRPAAGSGRTEADGGPPRPRQAHRGARVIGWVLAVGLAVVVLWQRRRLAANARLLAALRASHDELQDVALRALRGDF